MNEASKCVLGSEGENAYQPVDSRSPVIWDEDRTKFASELLIDAVSYRPYRLFDVQATQDWRDGIVSPHGAFAYANRILPEGIPLSIALNRRLRGRVAYTGDAIIPTLYDLSDPLAPYPWMSMTPMEVFTQRPGLQRASGVVVVGGLGLGWFISKVHDREQVERVILVEMSRELLDWYGEELCRRLPKVTDVICGDVYDHIGRFGPRAKHLLDIWRYLGEYQSDPKFNWHKRHYRHVWGWGEE